MKKFLMIGSVVLIGLTAWAQAPEMGHGRGFGGGEGRFLWTGPGSRTPVTGAPYSATQTTTFQQTLGNGNQITREQVVKVYRDSQGRVRMEHTRTPPGSTTSQTMVTIFDPVAGYSYMLNTTSKTVVKTQLPAPRGGGSAASTRQANVPTRSNAQRQSTDLGKQTMNGVPSTGTRVVETIPVGAIGNAQAIQVTRETWVSSDLKVPVQITTNDPRFGTTTMQLSNITESEPDASLFQIPTDYTVSTRTARRPGMSRPQQ